MRVGPTCAGDGANTARVLTRNSCQVTDRDGSWAAPGRQGEALVKAVARKAVGGGQLGGLGQLGRCQLGANLPRAQRDYAPRAATRLR
jgi:hypothetical protein